MLGNVPGQYRAGKDIMILCFGVTCSGENDVCGVNLSLYSHRAS